MTAANKSLKSLFDMSGKTAVVTGGAGWLGSSMCEALAEQGAHVFIASRNSNRREDLIERISKLYPDAKLTSVTVDITDRKSVDKCFAEVFETTGRFDVLINNAYGGPRLGFEDTNELDWAAILDIGLTGYMRCMQAALHHMKNKGSGVILNVASMYGLVSPCVDIYEGTDYLNPPAYGAVKSAILQLTRYAAVHLACYGLRVNSISPGAFPSMDVQQDGSFITKLSSKTPLGRIGAPDEIKGAIAFLCSDASSFVTGHNLVVDGGWTAW